MAIAEIWSWLRRILFFWRSMTGYGIGTSSVVGSFQNVRKESAKVT